MRTTLNLPDDVYEEARNLAHYSKISMGQAVAELVRRNSHPPRRIIFPEGGFPYLDMGPNPPVITTEQVLAIQAESE